MAFQQKHTALASAPSCGLVDFAEGSLHAHVSQPRCRLAAPPVVGLQAEDGGRRLVALWPVACLSPCFQLISSWHRKTTDEPATLQPWLDSPRTLIWLWRIPQIHSS